MVRTTLTGVLAIAVALGTIGCGKPNDYKPVNAVKAAPLADHEHGAKGPHGGSIVELGEEEYHGEVVVDHDAHAVVVYVLGKDAKTAEAIPATEVKITPEGKDALTLKAAPQKDDPEGKSSKFELVDGDVVHALMDAGMLHGKLQLSVGEKSYDGSIDYHLDHHDAK